MRPVWWIATFPALTPLFPSDDGQAQNPPKGDPQTKVIESRDLM